VTQTILLIDVVTEAGTTLPALVYGTPESATVLRELLMITRRLVQAGWSRGSARHLNRTVMNLMQLYVADGLPTLDQDGMVAYVWRYLHARAYGTVKDATDPLGLFWEPVQWSTLKQDLHAIQIYSDLCAKQFGHIPLIGRTPLPHREDDFTARTFERIKSISRRDFFAHLAMLRADRPELAVDVPVRAPTTHRGGSCDGRAVMTEQFAWDLYEAETNPLYKMVWLLGFWGGCRISEQANLWLCDVLPGTYRRMLFPGDIFEDFPLVVLADPWNSTYCGDIGDARQSRQQYLLARYGMRPRPDLASVDGGARSSRTSGFKGMLLTNRDRMVSQIFWASSEAAKLYDRHFAWLLGMHEALRTGDRHPYLLINTDPRKPEVRGEMISLDNLKKAWERACRRVGAQPYRFGRSRHGMRHFYKNYLEHALHLDRRTRKVMLHHRSEDSQDLYGSTNLHEVRHVLAAASRKPHLENV